MAQVGIAQRAAHLGAHAAEAEVLEFGNQRGVNGFGKGRPAAAGVELVRGQKQRLPCGDVHIDARLKQMVVLVLEGALGLAFLGHGVLQGRQDLLQLLLGFHLIDRLAARLLCGHGFLLACFQGGSGGDNGRACRRSAQQGKQQPGADEQQQRQQQPGHATRLGLALLAVLAGGGIATAGAMLTRAHSRASISAAMSSGLSPGAKRLTTLPSRSTRNLVKFHLMAPPNRPLFSPFR